MHKIVISLCGSLLFHISCSGGGRKENETILHVQNSTIHDIGLEEVIEEWNGKT